jgi:outer membrane protein assembly factor BamD
MPVRRLGLVLSLFALAPVGLAALAPLGLAGCSAGGPAVAADAAEAYARGLRAMERRRYDRAIEAFRAAIDFGRATPVARDAQLALARAYAADRQELLAGQEFSRFIEFYADDPRVEEAEFERLQAYYRLSPDYELDQTDTERAIEYIRLFLQRHPDGPRAAEAGAMMDELREKLARKRYEAARLYERRELFEAAVLTFRSVLEDYPASTWADDAMLGALRAQTRYAEASVAARQGARFAEALALYDRLVELFPRSPLLAEAEGIYDRAFAGRQAAEARAGG